MTRPSAGLVNRPVSFVEKICSFFIFFCRASLAFTSACVSLQFKSSFSFSLLSPLTMGTVPAKWVIYSLIQTKNESHSHHSACLSLILLGNHAASLRAAFAATKLCSNCLDCCLLQQLLFWWWAQARCLYWKQQRLIIHCEQSTAPFHSYFARIPQPETNLAK